MIIPQWTNTSQPGVKSVTESVIDGSIHLSITEATTEADGYTVVYYIYGGESPESASILFFTTETEVDIPVVLAGSGWYWKATASVTSLFIDTNLLIFPGVTQENLNLVSENLYLFPQEEASIESLLYADGFPDTPFGYKLDQDIGFACPADYRYSGSQGVYGATTIISGNLVSPFSFFPISLTDYQPQTAPMPYLEVGMSVSLDRGYEIDGYFIRSLPSCGLPLPQWLDQRHIGLEKVEDVGDGYSVILSWDRAIVPDGFSDTYYNIYKSESAYSLYRDPPYGFCFSSPVQFQSSRPDKGIYYGVRAAYSLADFSTSGMTSNNDIILYPENTELVSDFLFGDGYATVTSTNGFPDLGFFVIGKRICRYLSKTDTTFNNIQQNVFAGEDESDYPAGTTISLFVGIEDRNPYFWRMTTSWDGLGVSNIPVVAGDGYFGNLYLQDDDGYRNIPIANFNENHDIVDEDAAEADPYDFCGLRNNDPAQFTSGQYCAPNTVHGTGTYHGNSARGEAGGINVFEQNLARQELLLSVTGEPFVLLRRKWTGRTCPRISHRNEHPDGRCSICYSTSFQGGYDRFVNPRQIRASEPNPNGLILMRVAPYADEVALLDSRGFSVEKTDLNAWVPAVPTIRDRDILIRYYFDYETSTYREEFRYEVISVTRNKINLGKDGAQQIVMKRLNVTEEIYKFPVNLI